MRFFSKLMKQINGVAQAQNRPEDDQPTKRATPETLPTTSATPATSQPSEAAETTEKPATEKPVATHPDTKTPTPKEASVEGNKVEFDEQGLYSGSAADQRYTWHRLLKSLLSSINIDKPGNLRYFTVFIRQTAGVSYAWNDDSMKRELLKELESYDCASHIGKSAKGGGTFTIEVVNERKYTKEAERQISDTQFRKIFKAKDIEIILSGSKTQTAEQRFATAIDKRAFIINEFIKKFRDSTGADAKLMEDLVIVVIRNEDDNDMAKYDWVGKKFEDDLKLKLTNAFLGNIGSKSIQIVFKPQSETDGCICLIDNEVYYKWGKTDIAKNDDPIPYVRGLATISVIEETGTLDKPTYTLDSDIKTLYHIGRGISSRNSGKYRINDIVIKDNEPDPDLHNRNGHVSSAQADIVFKDNKFYLRAAIGGCRAIGGTATKIVHNEIVTELRDTNLLYLLEDGDIIELGKNVLLVYTLSGEGSSTNIPEKPKSNNAMSVDDSF